MTPFELFNDFLNVFVVTIVHSQSLYNNVIYFNKKESHRNNGVNCNTFILILNR